MRPAQKFAIGNTADVVGLMFLARMLIPIATLIKKKKKKASTSPDIMKEEVTLLFQPNSKKIK